MSQRPTCIAVRFPDTYAAYVQHDVSIGDDHVVKGCGGGTHGKRYYKCNDCQLVWQQYPDGSGIKVKRLKSDDVVALQRMSHEARVTEMKQLSKELIGKMTACAPGGRAASALVELQTLRDTFCRKLREFEQSVTTPVDPLVAAFDDDDDAWLDKLPSANDVIGEHFSTESNADDIDGHSLYAMLNASLCPSPPRFLDEVRQRHLLQQQQMLRPPTTRER